MCKKTTTSNHTAFFFLSLYPSPSELSHTKMGGRFSFNRKPRVDHDNVEDEVLVAAETMQPEGNYVLCRRYDEGAVCCVGADEALHDLSILSEDALTLSDGTALARLLAHAIKCRQDTTVAGEVFDVFEIWRRRFPPRLKRQDTLPF